MCFISFRLKFDVLFGRSTKCYIVIKSICYCVARPISMYTHSTHTNDSISAVESEKWKRATNAKRKQREKQKKSNQWRWRRQRPTAEQTTLYNADAEQNRVEPLMVVFVVVRWRILTSARFNHKTYQSRLRSNGLFNVHRLEKKKWNGNRPFFSLLRTCVVLLCRCICILWQRRTPLPSSTCSCHTFTVTICFSNVFLSAVFVCVTQKAQKSCTFHVCERMILLWKRFYSLGGDFAASENVDAMSSCSKSGV